MSWEELRDFTKQVANGKPGLQLELKSKIYCKFQITLIKFNFKHRSNKTFSSLELCCSVCCTSVIFSNYFWSKQYRIQEPLNLREVEHVGRNNCQIQFKVKLVARVILQRINQFFGPKEYQQRDFQLDLQMPMDLSKYFYVHLLIRGPQYIRSPDLFQVHIVIPKNYQKILILFFLQSQGKVFETNNGKFFMLTIDNVKTNLELVVPFFLQNPLLSSKYYDFEKFAEAVYMINSARHKTIEGVRKIINLAFAMNSSKENESNSLRRYTKEQYISYLELASNREEFMKIRCKLVDLKRQILIPRHYKYKETRIVKQKE
eukprot:TRINITY_DN50796_c0_g1_i1.p1 TRINITY_DN50796_c0_g1~~TRINITY_DN50796_c0_g1_i1.p1  ORF type:complete len:317 (+),score=-4.89 TRINITY_DN50796_c0_g1_i1:251-1201(+)